MGRPTSILEEMAAPEFVELKDLGGIGGKFSATKTKRHCQSTFNGYPPEVSWKIPNPKKPPIGLWAVSQSVNSIDLERVHLSHVHNSSYC